MEYHTPLLLLLPRGSVVVVVGRRRWLATIEGRGQSRSWSVVSVVGQRSQSWMWSVGVVSWRGQSLSVSHRCQLPLLVMAVIVTHLVVGAACRHYHCWCHPALRPIVLSREEAVE